MCGCRRRSTRTSAQAETAYWSLVAARAAVDVQQRALDLALELERTNRARVDVGQSPPLDLVTARAEVAQRRENLIVARTDVAAGRGHAAVAHLQSEAARFLDRASRAGRRRAARRVRRLTSTPPCDARLSERPDIAEARKQIQISDTNVALSKNQTLPDLRLQATYVTNGLGGSKLVRTGGFPGTIIGFDNTSFGSVLESGSSPRITRHGRLASRSIIRLARASRRRTSRARKLEREQANARLQSTELVAVREVRDAAHYVSSRTVSESRPRELGRELAEQRLDAEQKRFEVGMSTSFLVIQAQRDSPIARNNELQAKLAYQLAVIAFEAVQTTSGGIPAVGVNAITGR